MELFEISGDQNSPVVVSAPHSGTLVPEEIRRQLAVPVAQVQEKVDAYIWDLAQAARPHATVVRARIARAVVDLSRSGIIADLDLSGGPEKERDRLVRLYDDQGYLRWKTPIGQPPMAREELERRVRRYYDPYHRALQECLERAGRPRVLVDLHSMSAPGLDLVIGDFRGRSAGAALCEGWLKPFFAARGYRVGYAGPADLDRQGRPVPAPAIRYSGGFITSRYGDPEQGQYAFQLEVNRETCRKRLAELSADFGEFFRWLRAEIEKGGVFGTRKV